jgi:hypothetical protein
MDRRTLLKGAGAVTVSFLGAEGFAEGPERERKPDRAIVTLARDGKATATIVVAENPTPSARLAALELQYHVERITGAVLPILTDAAPDIAGTHLLVGESAHTRKLGLKGDDFPSQEYLIAFRPDTLILIGRDWQGTETQRKEIGYDTTYVALADYRQKIDYVAATGHTREDRTMIELPGLYDDQGTCYAVYDFLERFCDVRWYGPTELNLSVRRRPTLTVGGADVRRAPAFAYRVGTGTWDWPILKTQWNDPSGDAMNLHWRRMRVGGEKWAGNHSFYTTYYDRFGKKNSDAPDLFDSEHPEFFAKGYDLGPNTQLCYTEPGLIQQVAQDARNYFDGKGVKGSKPAIGNYFAVVPMDDANWCQCPRCQALLNRDKDNHRGDHFASGTASHYLFGFVNAVAKEVRKTHPDKYIATLAYHVYSYPPDDFRLEPNVSVAPCLQTRIYWAPHIEENEIGTRKGHEGFYHKWVSAKDRPIYLWNYYCFPEEPALGGKWHCFPGFSARRAARLIKMYHRDGVRGVFLCGIGEQVDYYVTLKLYDDPALDANALIAEFFTRHFGAAAEPMRRFYDRIESIYNDSANYPPAVREQEAQFHQTEEIAWKWLGTAERMEELGKLMAQAEAAARTDDEKQRVALWKKGVWDYMVSGRQQYLAKQAG